MRKKRVLAAMSGGVDSSVMAALLLEQGYEVIGATMRLWEEGDEALQKTSRTCCALTDVNDAKRVAEVEIQKAQYKAEMERLNAEEIAQREIEKQKISIAAAAEADRVRTIAKGEADGVLMKYQAEAEGMKALHEKKAEGYRKLIESAGGDSKAAATMLMIEKLEAIVARQTEAISKLKIDKITVWDSASGEKGSSTANFISSLVKSLPPVQDVAAMAGMELPEYLGKIKQDEPKQ